MFCARIACAETGDGRCETRDRGVSSLKRLFGIAGALLIAVVAFGGLRLFAQSGGELPPLTRDVIDKLEPELCEQASYSFRSLTAALPLIVGSATTSMTDEQLSLIDEYKASGRRKVWVLRLPAAFITQRTCDAGRQNWFGNSVADRRVSQLYTLKLVLVDDRLVPETRARKDELDRGIRTQIKLVNGVVDPSIPGMGYATDFRILGIQGTDPVSCREEPSDIPGLVTFKRVDPAKKHPNDCEDQRGGVFARKIGDQRYEFAAICDVMCGVKRDYHGWLVDYHYYRKNLAEWQLIHERLAQFLDQHTFYRDEEHRKP